MTIRDEIIAELRKVRAPAKVARNLGVDIREVLKVADEIGGATRATRPEQFDGNGRPELLEFFVARKRAHVAWDNTIPEIAAARAAYEAGTHDMVTGRDGDWLILYSIPLRWPANNRTHYFKLEV